MYKNTGLKFFTITSMGFFSILAQTLLFRNFLIVFDGNELSIGIFFFTWLIWVCIGAYLAKIKLISKLSDYYPFLLLIYIPCFLLQYFLFLNTQSILGVYFFEIISLRKIIMFVFLFNAPVSLLTGFLFVISTDWIKERKTEIPVIKIYICEAFGSFLGASIVTLLLYFAFSEEYISLIGILILLIATAPHIRVKPIKIIFIGFTLICLFLAFSDYPKQLTCKINKDKWDGLIRGGKYLGSFQTPQAKYIYGKYNDELLVTTANSVYESYPDYNNSSNVVGEYLSQSSNAENVLVIGPGTFSICSVLSEINQIKKITWLDTDPQYPEHFLAQIPPETSLSKISVPGKDVRKFITQGSEGLVATSFLSLNVDGKGVSHDLSENMKSYSDKFDLIILHLPAPSNLLLNRYYSYEFFKQLKGVLSSDGVVGISFPGGENFLGPELSFLGGSILYTLQRVFSDIVLMPGAESTFFAASKKNIVTDSGNILVGRLKNIEGIEKIYSPRQIKSAYEKNRIDFQMSIYNTIIKQYPEKFLLNSDKSPKSFLYSLLLSVKTLSNISFSEDSIYSMLEMTFAVFIFIVSIYFLLRLFFYIVNGRKSALPPLNKRDLGTASLKAPCKFDLYMSVYIAAVVGMGINILLLFLFQINYGTVYLCFGLITALFMLGMTLNACLINRLLKTKFASKLLPLISVGFVAFLFLVYIYPPLNSVVYFSVLFFLAGFFCGSYFPISGFYLKKLKSSNRDAASNLEFADNIGGAVGSILCSIILLPIVGLAGSLFLFSFLLIAVTLHMLFLKSETLKDPISTDPTRFDNCIKSVGFILLGLAITFIFISNIPGGVKQRDSKTSQFTINSNQSQKGIRAEFTLSKQEVLDLTGNNNKVESKTVKSGGKMIYYYSIFDDKNKHLGHIFRTKDFSDSIVGYAGPIEMMSYLSPEGEIQNFVVVNSNETPSYLNEVMKKKNIFFGQKAKQRFSNEEYQINAITGATATSTAISEILYQSGRNFLSGLNSDALETVSSSNLKQNMEYQKTGAIKTILSNKSNGVSSSLIIFLLACFTALFARAVRKRNILKLKNIKRRILRFLFLIIILIVFGVIDNIQFSTDQIFTLISGRIYLNSSDIYLFLCIGIPVIVIIFGNIYCGYLCPFGALQEIVNGIVSFICPGLSNGNLRVSNIVWKITRSFKYILLFILTVYFVIKLDKNLSANTDILLNAFSFTLKNTALLLLLFFIFISISYKRMWCRVFCPTGAFLSILNGIHRVFRKSKVSVANCDVGVTNKNDFDCICCNKCYENTSTPKNTKSRISSLVFLLITVCIFILFVVLIQDKFTNKKQTESVAASIHKEQIEKPKPKLKKNIKFSEPVEPIKFMGKSRRINIDKYKDYISKSKLSDHEAAYYKQLD